LKSRLVWCNTPDKGYYEMAKTAESKIFLGVLADKLVFLPLYASEREIAELVLGERHEMWRDLARHLEERGLPPRSQLVGGLRFVPKVFRFFERSEFGISRDEISEFVPDGEENWGP
jgi:hypothetical protein